MNQRKVRVLFVCTGNICRSPTAEGIFRGMVEKAGLADRVETDSAGTTDYHVGQPPDPRTVEAAKRRNVDLAALRARKVTSEDFDVFDYVVAMDMSHHRALQAMTVAETQPCLHLFLHHARHLGVTDVPDPYYGGEQGFENVLDLIEEGCRGLLDHIRRHDLTA
jgi:protein-tyrosine phosphatase